MADNIKRLRDGVSYVELADRLAQIGRTIPTLGLRKIESYERRVDADDLVALAVALDVSPVTLLMPNTDDRSEVVEATAVAGHYPADDVWDWLRAEHPLKKPYTGPELLDFIGQATPAWRAREFGEGVLQLLELGRLERQLEQGGEVAATAQRRLEELGRERGWSYGND